MVTWQLRRYTINKGRLDDFVDAWRRGVYPLRLKFGFTIDGAWVIQERNEFVWIMSLPERSTTGGSGTHILRVGRARRAQPGSGAVDRAGGAVVHHASTAAPEPRRAWAEHVAVVRCVVIASSGNPAQWDRSCRSVTI